MHSFGGVGWGQDFDDEIRRAGKETARRSFQPGEARLVHKGDVRRKTVIGIETESGAGIQHHETDLETPVLNHLQAFLLELGTGFCFGARQKRITVGNEHDYVDLVFYHRRLRCHTRTTSRQSTCVAPLTGVGRGLKPAPLLLA